MGCARDDSILEKVSRKLKLKYDAFTNKPCFVRADSSVPERKL